MITKERERTLKTIHAGRPLKTINYLNILAFVLTYGANMESYGDVFDLWSPRQVQRYFCFLTPLKMTPMIMDIVVVFQGAFVIVQMMPRARNSSVVQDGIGCWYISAALCHVCLILGFNSFFNAIFTTFGMGALLYCSLRIVIGVSNSSRNEEHIDALELFWLFQFPFLLQVGWYIFVLIWGINVLLTFTVDNIWFDFFAFLAACGCITWIGIKMPCFREGSTDYTIASVLSWAMVSTLVDNANRLVPSIYPNFAHNKLL